MSPRYTRRWRSTRPCGRRRAPVREQPRRRGLAVRAGDLDHGDRRTVTSGSFQVGLADGDGDLGHEARRRAAERAVQRLGDRDREGLCGAAPPPREGDHDLLPVSGPVRARTARRRAPEATAIRRVSPAAIRAVVRRRCSEPARPARAAPIPSRSAARSTAGSPARSQPGTASVSLTAGRGKYRFGPSSTRSSTSSTARTIVPVSPRPVRRPPRSPVRARGRPPSRRPRRAR